MRPAPDTTQHHDLHERAPRVPKRKRREKPSTPRRLLAPVQPGCVPRVPAPGAAALCASLMPFHTPLPTAPTWALGVSRSLTQPEPSRTHGAERTHPRAASEASFASTLQLVPD